MSKHLIVSCLMGCMVASASLAMAHEEMGQELEFKLHSLNDSGVEGEVELKLRGHTLYVELEVSGLEIGKPHPQHIHGHENQSVPASCPSIDADANGDGLVSVAEGLPNYGPIILPLTPFNLVDAGGELNYRASFEIEVDKLQPLNKRAIVVHGMTVGSVYIPSLPVACGVVELDD
ncbi:MAG: hypothetical protein OEZ43_14145 [Gammaproteobacteria bacterium]|nr:hypothetical protein [Gammaproteobacteria bacterium]